MINTINSSNSISNNSPSIKSPISTPPSDPTQEQPKKIQKKFSKARKKKLSPKYILAGIMLLLLMIGGGIGLYLTQINQDLRQQADEGGYKGACKDGFTMIDGECISDDPIPEPEPTKKPGGDPDPTATPNPTEPPMCTQEAGSCIGIDGESCIEYTDGCEKDELCADPFEECTVTLSGQCEVCNESLPPGTPNSRCEEGLVCNTDNSTVEVGASGLCILPEETPEVCQTGELSCNDSCTEDINCSEVNENWSCYFGEDGAAETGTCRLASNLTSETCQNIDEPTSTPNPTTEPTDQPNNEDDDDSLDDSSNSFSESNSSTTVNIVSNQIQPEYPEELPQSGPEDWIQYLQVGLGALGVGAILLLFL